MYFWCMEWREIGDSPSHYHLPFTWLSNECLFSGNHTPMPLAALTISVATELKGGHCALLTGNQ